MKIGLHVGQLLQPVPGGIGRYVGALLDTLPDAGIELVPFAAGESPTRQGVRLPNYVDLGWPRAPWRYELWHRLRRPVVAVDADVVHAPSLAVPPTGSTPLVVTVHDVSFLRHPEAFTQQGIRFHRRGLAITYREAATVITASHFSCAELIDIGFPAERVHIAPHGVTVPAPEPDELIAKRIRRVGVREPYVLFVGTVEPRKGLDTLTAAFARVRRARAELSLVVVGPRGWLEVPGLDTPGVHAPGRVDDATLDALYRRALLCAVPSRYEGFGLPALEAMARGCPVMASATTSLPEVVAAAGRLVPPGNTAAWAEALEALVDDTAARAELSARGRERAVGFTPEASARAHVAAYTAAKAIGHP